MIKKFSRLAIVMFSTLVCMACDQQIKEDKLYGTWKYQKVEYLSESPIRVEQGESLDEKNAYIRFAPDKSAEISSSGKTLSRGSFALEGKIIRYEEVFEDGGTRKIPFLVKEITNDQLIFETMDKDVKRITAHRD